MTPNDIEMLIYFHCSSSAHPRIDAPACQEAVRMMLCNDLIRHSGRTFGTTDKGAAHLAQLCATPFPEQAWVDSQGRVIEA